jgi:serine phosphatase RsbU (regulator of sigma subunit)
MDIALCRFNLTTSELEYAGANNSIWIVTKHIKLPVATKRLTAADSSLYLHEIKATKQPVGQYTKRIPFETHKIQLEKNDLVYLFTDGYADQFGGVKNKKFKYASLKALLLSVANLGVDQQREALKTTFNSWRGALEQVDDVCVVGVKV